MGDYRIEWLDGPEDLDAVQEVDLESFPSPWTRAMYEEELRHVGLAFIAVLRTDADRVAGYCSFRLIVDELEISNVAVRPVHRGRGYGRALVEFAVRHGREAGARTVLLEVRRSNIAAQRLYAALGFVQIAERARYYHDPEDDALVMARNVRILEEDPAS